MPEAETRACQNCKTEFVLGSEDFDFYKKVEVPLPTFCPECRSKRRMAWRNERTLYRRKCDLCSAGLLSIYAPESPFIIYCQQCWWSDKWSAAAYARDVSFDKPFLEQFFELYREVPRCALYNMNSVGSEYCNLNISLKNCYLVFGSGFAENCLYGTTLAYCKDILDSSWVNKCERSAYLIDCDSCFDTFYSQDSQDCVNSMFLFDCRNCQNCILSANLRNKSYVVRNRQVDKETFEKARSELAGSYAAVKNAVAEFSAIKQAAIHRHMMGKNYVRSTGNFIFNSKNTLDSYFIYDSEDLLHCVKSVKQKDSADGFGSSLGDKTYETMNADYCSNSSVILNASYAGFSAYVADGQNNTNLFGCVGLRDKQYCILNKQYAKEEYEQLKNKIVRHMDAMPYRDKQGRVYGYGEFFPSEMSPFAYNETMAQEYFMLTKEDAEGQGYRWKAAGERNYAITLKAADLPDRAEDISSGIIDQVIECEHMGECNEQCTKAFKIISQELQFLQQMRLPAPRLCPNCRHYQRFRERNPLRLWHRACMCQIQHPHHSGNCQIEFETSYAPDRPEIVYCEQCYQAEVA